MIEPGIKLKCGQGVSFVIDCFDLEVKKKDI
jgi:hypothetical protein